MNTYTADTICNKKEAYKKVSPEYDKGNGELTPQYEKYSVVSSK